MLKRYDTKQQCFRTIYLKTIYCPMQFNFYFSFNFIFLWMEITLQNGTGYVTEITLESISLVNLM